MDRKESALSSLFKMVNKLEDWVLCTLVVGMIVVIMLQIIGRVSGHPLPWTEETSRYLFLWMMFVALASGFNRCESSRVKLLLQVGPNWLKKFSVILYGVAVIGFFVFMLVFGIQVVQQQIQWKEMGTALVIPMWIIGICQPIGAVLGIIGTIQSFIEFPDRITIGDTEAEKKKALEDAS